MMLSVLALSQQSYAQISDRFLSFTFPTTVGLEYCQIIGIHMRWFLCKINVEVHHGK